MIEMSLKVQRMFNLLIKETNPSLIDEFAKCLMKELTPMELWSSEVHDRIVTALYKGNWQMLIAINIIYGKNALERIAEKIF